VGNVLAGMKGRDCRAAPSTAVGTRLAMKWAFSEAGNSVAVNRERYAGRHVSRLYSRIRRRKNHAKAIGAVAGHLAESTYWILSKGETYRERGQLEVSSTPA
jgi:hypothetical protein